MLVFAPDVIGESALFGSSSKSDHLVKALLVGSAVIINDCLSEVIAVIQRLARDNSRAFIHGLEANRLVLRIDETCFDDELFVESLECALDFWSYLLICLNALIGFSKHVSDRSSRPRTQ